MDKQLIWLLVVAFAVTVLIAWRLNRRVEKRRTEQLGVVASHLGFAFSPEPQFQLVQRLDHLPLFSRGHAQRAWNVLSRNVGDVQVLIFDYRYETGVAQYGNRWEQTVLLFESDRLQLPAFSLRPQDLLDGLGGIHGQRHIKLPTDPGFYSGYYLEGQDEDSVRALFSKAVIAYFARHRHLCIEGNGKHLIWYPKGSCVEPEDIPDFFQEGLDILDLWIKKDGAAEGLELIGLDHTEASISECDRRQ